MPVGPSQERWIRWYLCECRLLCAALQMLHSCMHANAGRMRTKAMPPLVCSAVWLPTRRRLPPERIRSAVLPVLDDHLLQEARGRQLLQQQLQRRRLRGGLLAVGPLRVRIGTMTTTILDPVLGAPARELLFLIRCRPRGEYLWDGRTDQVWTKYTELEKRRRKREREKEYVVLVASGCC